jgi:hypothetical protein
MTIWVELPLIADSALFYLWPSVCNCCVLLFCTLLSVTICVQLLLIADSALFYLWPSVYNCCVLLFLHCFIRHYLCTTAAYRWLRTVLSVTICVQLLRIAVSALFYPWLSVYICCLSLNPHCFIWPSVYNYCILLFLHCFIRDYLFTTAAYRWLRTV